VQPPLAPGGSSSDGVSVVPNYGEVNRRKGAFEQPEGITIQSVIISQYNASSARHQLFLIFDDDTSFKVFGEEPQGANAGGEQRVLEYARKYCGTIQKI